MLLALITPPPQTAQVCAQATFQVHVETEDANSNLATVRLKMIAGPSAINIETDQTIDLSHLDQCLDANFQIDPDQTAYFQTKAISGDTEFQQYAIDNQPVKASQISVHYHNTPHNGMQNGLHHYFMYLIDSASGHSSMRYTVDPMVRNRPPANNLLLVLALLVILGGVEFLLAIVASQLRRLWD